MRRRSWRALGGAALILLLLAMAGHWPAQAADTAGREVVAEIPLADGSSNRVLYLRHPHPVAVLVMLPGGDGLLAIQPDGRILRPANFLIRTREQWVAQGFSLLLPDTPGGRSLLGQRRSPAYAETLARLIAYVRSDTSVPVWLVGTSQGATAAMNGGAHLVGRVAGIVLTSSVSRQGLSGETVFDADPGRVTVPALVVANTGDGCNQSPSSDAELILAALSSSRRKEAVLLSSNGRGAKADECGPMAPHGYFGMEAEAVQRISSWIKAAAR